MKKYVLMVLMCLPLWGMSQSTVEWTVFGKAGVDIRSQMISFGGTALEWHPKDGKLGLNYSLRFGHSENNNFIFQCPVSAVTSIFAIALLADDGWDASILALLCLIPEGLSYDIPCGEDLWVSPYVNPLLVEFSSNGGALLGEVGARIKVPIRNRFFASADFSMQSSYGDWKINTLMGISMGFRF